ncbi:perlucin-like protein isoform X1 [Homarus americanus]|uniref:perlucin-like protein isoform X1 n=1 Tax=Homarus americanus TaxID=6706 RepID=UPI001C440E57|nr:perlucin-like protein isoform X1 [Homarus americanus]
MKPDIFILLLLGSSFTFYSSTGAEMEPTSYQNTAREHQHAANHHQVTRSATDQCPIPYITIGGRCLFFDIIATGSWHDKKYICETLDGHLAIVDDANFLGDITDYIYAHELTAVAYWLGASDEEEEGSWKWVDGSPMRMGMPLWHNCTHPDPDGGVKQNCLEIDSFYSYYFIDDVCDLMLNSICEYDMQKSTK